MSVPFRLRPGGRPRNSCGGRATRCPAVLALCGALSLASGTAAAAPAPGAAELAAVPHYSLPLALQQSLFFYDAEKSGPSRSQNHQPLEWRGDSELQDAAVALQPMDGWVGTNMSASFISEHKAVLDPDGNGTVDLSGGFHDAGDHVKFGLPATYTAATLGWGLYEFPDGYKATNTWNHALEEMAWFSDYFLRSLFRDSSGKVVAFAYQVGDGSVDHAYWGAPELQDEKEYPRPAYFATEEEPASDMSAGAAAALTVHSLIVKESDPAYSTRMLTAAKALYEFAVEHRGLGYSGGFYGSSFDEDELSWAATWLYMATSERRYLDDILSTDSAGNWTGYVKKIVGNSTDGWNNIWVMSWDTKWGGVFSLLDPIVQKDTTLPAKVRDSVHYFDKWHVEYWSHVPHDLSSDTTFLARSPGGYQVLAGWGSARYNTAGQLTALAYRNHFPDDPKSVKFSDWAMGQMNYIMGDNPLKRSYIVGFGSTTPGVGDLVGGDAVAAQHPHHAAAHGSLTNDQDVPPTHRHVLWGGLVGGPGLEDEHKDLTTDYVYNEVAVDYNAAMVGALAGLYRYYGTGQKMTSFTPPLEPETVDYYTTAVSTRNTSSSSQVTVTVHNDSMRPPHYQKGMSARYFFDISEIHEQGQGIDAVSTEIYYDASGTRYGHPASVGGPVRWGGEKSCVYYVTLDWSTAPVSGARDLQFGLNEAQTSDWKNYWDPTNDPSYSGLAEGTWKSTPDPHIPLYQDGELVFGKEPSTTADETCGEPSGTEPEDPEVTAQYSDMTGTASSPRIANSLQVTNTGTTPITLSRLTVRYWFTADGDPAPAYACDYTPRGCSNVTGRFVGLSPAVEGADRYLELGFTSGAGKLFPGNSTGPIQNRMHRSDHQDFDQSDDWSFDRGHTSLRNWDRITVHYDGELVFGTPPR